MTPDEDLRAARGVRAKADALVWTFSRSSGAGGQNVNKNSTKATLTIALADISCSETIRARLEASFDEQISITCQTSRSQWRNRVMCVEQLVEKLNEASAPPLHHARKRVHLVALLNGALTARSVIQQRNKTAA